MKIADLPVSLIQRLHRGMVIPALPLALDRNRRLAPDYQRALVRYYLEAGAGGIAVGVHSTQFEIREPGIDLLEPILKLAGITMDQESANQPAPLKIAGVCGRSDQALREVDMALSLGYHGCLLSLAAMVDADLSELLEHCRRIADRMPVVGFYLQPAVGGRILPYSFWRRFVELDNVLAIKIAPFNRYQTLDVVRAVCEAGREREIALYTGNDDNILVDLLTPFKIVTGDGEKTVWIKGGLLGHWSAWTRTAVKLLKQVREVVDNQLPVPPEMLSLAIQITDCNAAFFDVANRFSGCIPGIHEVLRRQGLLPGNWCLDPGEGLSPGQANEIDRVCRSYPHLNDNEFVAANLRNWLRE